MHPLAPNVASAQLLFSTSLAFQPASSGIIGESTRVHKKKNQMVQFFLGSGEKTKGDSDT